MAHCFDIHKSDRPCPHSPPEKQKHDAGIGKFVRVEPEKSKFIFNYLYHVCFSGFKEFSKTRRLLQSPSGRI
jgi:hypothetical protein